VLVYINRLSDDVHAFLVKLLNAPREVVDMESVLDTHAEVLDLEVKPVGVTFRVCVHLHL
jgi:hypothetical protein